MSFRRRLTNALIFFGAIFLIVPILVFYYQVKATMSQNLDDALKSVARAEMASTFDEPGEEPHIHESTSPLLLSLDSGLHELAWILAPDGEVLAKSSELQDEEILRLVEKLPQPSSEGSFVTLKINRVSYRLLVATQNHQKRDFLEVFGLSREPLLERLASLKRQAGTMFLVALVILVLAARRLSVRLTQPMTTLAAELENLDPESERSLRLENKPSDRELQILFTNVNSVLERLDYMLETQKHFVSDTSHEIRAPLTNLRLAIEVCLRKERSPEDYREVLVVCEQEVTRLVQMAERLLTLTRLESDQLALSVQQTDLTNLVEEAVHLVAERLEQRNLKIDLTCPPELDFQCDSGAIRQSVDNLLDNSLRYAPDGSTISLVLESNNGEACFSIENGASQLDEEQCSRVFERFFRGDASRQRETGGAGLGLAIVKGVVKAHKGKVGVERLENDRVQFWFSLPRPTTAKP